MPDTGDHQQRTHAQKTYADQAGKRTRAIFLPRNLGKALDLQQ